MNLKLYLNRDNVITLGLLKDKIPVNATTLTRVVLQFDPKAGGAVISIDSDSVPALFDFTTSQQFSGEITGVLKLKLGAMAGVIVGKYKMAVVVYDAVNTNGITWAELDAQVLDDAA